jgi:DNA-binding FadR family transcriptional regulator
MVKTGPDAGRRALTHLSSSPGKSGLRIARQIEAHIIDSGFEPGARLGSETELIEQYSIGRSILREAVRILEYDGIAAMRRGPGGGLFVTAPSGDGLVHAAALWLHLNDAQTGDLFEVREILESRCAVWAAERIDPAGTDLLRAMLDEERALAEARSFEAYSAQTLKFHQVVAELAGNAVARLVVTMLADLTEAYGAANSYSAEDIVAETRAHEAIVHAIVAGDGPLASQRMTAHLRASRTFAEESSKRSTRRRGPARQTI